MLVQLAWETLHQSSDTIDAIEKYGILGLLYIVLAGIGGFLVKVGFDMNKSIQANTAAVGELVTELKLLVQQNVAMSASIQQQMATHTQNAIETFRRGLDDVREEIRSGRKGT